MMLLAAINWHSVMFLLFALLACGFAVAVVLATSNIVRMAFYLTLCRSARPRACSFWPGPSSSARCSS